MENCRHARRAFEDRVGAVIYSVGQDPRCALGRLSWSCIRRAYSYRKWLTRLSLASTAMVFKLWEHGLAWSAGIIALAIQGASISRRLMATQLLNRENYDPVLAQVLLLLV